MLKSFSSCPIQVQFSKVYKKKVFGHIQIVVTS